MEVQLAPISANPDVLKLYHKQKTEFHFQQKSDNEFLVFLLDVAVKVISFVDQIKPNLMDACSDEFDKEERPQRKSGESGNGSSATCLPPKVASIEDDKRQPSGERPAKIMKQSSFGGLPPFKSYPDSSSFRQSEILQRQHEIMSRQVDTFPFPNLPENVIKPTFVKEGSRRAKLKSSSQGSPASNSHVSDGEKTPELEENNGTDKQDDSSMDVSSAPSTPLPRDYRARSESSAGNRHIPIPTGDRQPLDFSNLSPSKIHEHGLMTEQQKSRVLDINKIAATTIPSMAYMFSDKLATSAENTSDNLAQRGRHSIGLQWASEYKFDGSALHIMNGRNSRKPRTVFTWEQLKQMEETFKQKKYLCTEDRMILAQKLDLTDEQIKVWFQNRRQKWKKGGSKDDEVIEYSQYYDLFSRDSHGQAVNQGHDSDNNNRDENNQRSINIPDHLRMKTEQICLSSIQQEQQNRALIQEQEQTLKDELQRSIIDLKQSQTNNEERHLIREQQIRAVAEESNTRSPATEPAHAMAE